MSLLVMDILYYFAPPPPPSPLHTLITLFQYRQLSYCTNLQIIIKINEQAVNSKYSDVIRSRSHRVRPDCRPDCTHV